MNSWLESTTGLVLRDPELLAVAILLPIAMLARRLRAPPAITFAPAGLVEPGARSWRLRLVRLPRTLEVVAILLAVLALARPARREPYPLEAQGIDIVLCLDASSSMLANDMDERRTRLEVAKDSGARFIAARTNDRIGLVRFARYPDLLCPPTLDHAALAEILGDVSPVASDDPEDATGIGGAVARAAQVLQSSGAPSRIVVLLTDGDENVAHWKSDGGGDGGSDSEIAPLHAEQLCASLGIRIYSIVVGAVGAAGPPGGSGGDDAMQVRRMAEGTGGAFFRASDARVVDAVYSRIDALERAPLEEPRFALIDAFLPFLIAAIALLAAARALDGAVLRVLP